MQDKKKCILSALAKTLKELRGERSQFIVASENDIPISILSTAERGIKDPQLTTIYKLAEAYNLSFSEFAKLIEKNLPKDFSIIER